MTDRLQMIRNIKIELSGIKKNDFEPLEKGENDPCYEDYVQVGTKMVDGREVPNCVPLEASKTKQKFVIPEPTGSETQDEYVSRCISSIIDEYGQEQAAAICYGQWDKK